MIQFHRKADGILTIDSSGKCRYLNWWESVLYRVGILHE